MPQTITPSGLAHRTKPMDYSQAQRFARCLQANPLFCDVATVEARTKEPRQYVTFRPVNPDRQGDMLQKEFDKRDHRAMVEGPEYIFWQDVDRDGITWCFNPKSGETYELTLFDCSCPSPPPF